jgi:dihydrofolate synthase / folylpolyglutamate synthase
MSAVVTKHEFTEALARLDALTNREKRPRGGMRVGLEPMCDLKRRFGAPFTLQEPEAKDPFSALLESI